MGPPEPMSLGNWGPRRVTPPLRVCPNRAQWKAAARLTKRPAGQDRQNQEKPRRGDGATTPTPLSKNESWAVELLAVAPWRIANLSG